MRENEDLGLFFLDLGIGDMRDLQLDIERFVYGLYPGRECFKKFHKTYCITDALSNMVLMAVSDKSMSNFQRY